MKVTRTEVIARLDNIVGRMPVMPGRALWRLVWTRNGVECTGGDLKAWLEDSVAIP